MAQRLEHHHVGSVPLPKDLGADARGAPTPALGTPVAGGPTVVKIKTYEQLDGGQGRQVFFRPQRYGRNDLGSVRAVLRLLAAGAEHHCDIVDVSQNGAGFEWPDGVPVEVGDIVHQLSLSFDSHEAYRGEARVGSIREVNGKKVVGVSFVDSLMNVDDVLQLRDVKARSAESRALNLRERPWRGEGDEKFKSLVAEMRLFLEDAHKQLGALETSLPWNVVHGETESPARDELERLVHDEFVTEFVRLSEQIDPALRAAATSRRQPLKEFSRALLQQYLLQGPSMDRALYKPLGYPGDYEIMKFMYESAFAGPTLFAKAMNLAIMSTRPAEAVRQRKELIKQRLSSAIDAAAASGKPLRFLSIAAGPAQEVYELLCQRDAIPTPVQIVLFDQDRGALSYAWGRIKRQLDAKWPKNVSVVYLHDSIKRLLRDATIFQSFGAFDIIFCCGLFDYLELPTAVTLAHNLHRNLAPGGSLYIGNMVPTQPNRWFMELHLDWFLIYRTRAEMMDLARVAAPGARSHIVDEPTGINPFIAINQD